MTMFNVYYIIEQCIQKNLIGTNDSNGDNQFERYIDVNDIYKLTMTDSIV